VLCRRDLRKSGIFGNALAIAGKFIRDQNGGQGLEPSFRAGEKLAPVIGGIEVSKA